MEQIFSLAGRLAIVTGGGTGIGLAITRAFIQAGARVVITGRREEVLQSARTALGGNVICRSCNISDLAAIPGLVETVESCDGPIDILVNNAGITLKKPTVETTDEEFARVIQTNLMGLFSITREVTARMLPRRKGVILNIASMAAIYGMNNVPGYSASKTGILGLTRGLAVELGPVGIRVNAIAPGFIFSEMTAKTLNADPERKARVFARTPMGRMGQPDEIGAAALFLCSDAASFVTGVNLPVDGGNSIGF